MPIKFPSYRLKDGDNANAALFNKVIQDVDLRVAGVEDKATDFDTEKQKFVEAGLVRLDEIMLPITERLRDYASLGAILTTTSASDIEVGDGYKVFIVDEVKRDQFAPSAYLAIIKTGDPSQAMLGSLIAYDADTGALTVDVDRHEGSGYHTGWTITAASATDNAAAIAEVGAHRTAAETAAGQALAYRDQAETSKEGAVAAKNIAETEAGTADDARVQAQIAQSAAEVAALAAQAYMQGFLGSYTDTRPTARIDSSPLQVGDWIFRKVTGTPDTYFIDYVTSIGPVVWRSLTAAADTSVTSFNGRTGGVNPASGDYTASLITLTAIAGLAGSDVQAVLQSIKTALDTKAAHATTVVGGGLASGGGDLSANRTITVTKSSNAQALAGTDDTTAMTPVRVKEAIVASAPGAATESASGLVELATNAETITGTDTTRATHSAGVKAAIDAAIAALVASAPGVLNTLDEIAAALGDDPNFATTMTTQLATKLNASAYTAADVLAKLLGVDGAGSGLDADTVDGLQAAALAKIGESNTFTGDQRIVAVGADGTQRFLARFYKAGGSVLRYAFGLDSNNEPVLWTYDNSGIYAQGYQFRADTIYVGANAVWHAGNFTPSSKVDTSTSISPGTGMEGGGTLAASRTLSFSTTWGDARYWVRGVTTASNPNLNTMTAQGSFRIVATPTNMPAEFGGVNDWNLLVFGDNNTRTQILSSYSIGRTFIRGGYDPGGGTYSWEAWKELVHTGNAATAANYRANSGGTYLTPAVVWSAMAEVTLTDAATIAWDLATGFDFVVTLAASRTLGFPTNLTVGKRGRLRVVQPAGGGCTLSYQAGFVWSGGTVGAVDTGANRETYLDYDVVAAGKVRLACSPGTR